MSISRKRINILSIGLDGCLFNPQYDKHGECTDEKCHTIHSPPYSKSYQEWMQLGNKVFIDAVTKELAAKQYQQILLMVGDTRQSNMLDTLHHGSFPQQGNGFVALCTLGTILSETLKSSNTDVKVDGYLLADTYGNQPPGTSLQKYIHTHTASYNDPPWLIDTSLLSVLYAQIHKQASEHSEDEIVYDYYHGDAAILQALQDFCLANSDLIPHNVKLRLHHYAGAAITNHPDIQGTGIIDRNYHHNIKLMAQCAGVNEADIDDLSSLPYIIRPELIGAKSVLPTPPHPPPNFLTELTGDKLRQFKQQRQPASFFQRHKKAILIGAIIGAVLILAVLAVFTFGIAPAVIGGIAAATSLSTGAVIGIGAAAGAVAGAGLGMAGGAAVGAIVDHRAKKGTAAHQTSAPVVAASTTPVPAPAARPPSSTTRVARVIGVPAAQQAHADNVAFLCATTPLPHRQRINVRSVDFDGCIFNEDYCRNPQDSKRLLAYNETFLKTVSQEIRGNHYNDVIWMVGSSRQDKGTDMLNALHNKGSCFPALNRLCAEMQHRVPQTPCRVDRYLLADAYGNQPPGENFTRALGNASDYPFSEWLFDETKFSILYAQIHKIASENPDADVDYDFYDDREDILTSLQAIFTKHPDLIPHNVKLRLHHYDGRNIRQHIAIQGSGTIDNNYHNNVKFLAQCAGYDPTPGSASYRDAKSSFAEPLMAKKAPRLKTFMAKRQLWVPTPSMVVVAPLVLTR
ncbi:MAG: hypothetical protein A3E83_05945 [Gammaproteobacteria bacterium RIFCSPHIGHO2_12_FULL_41_20]|nr:MAG: hypothetical protein A3E83_05945 [Gammaproteobacteria bacterium RIFCSPHIGHO2_12_FULL_41_20]